MPTNVINPRTGEADYLASYTDPAAVAGLACQLRSASLNWRCYSVEQRIEMIAAWAEHLSQDLDILDALVIDTGREQTSRAELAGPQVVIGKWRQWAPDTLADDAERTTEHPGISIGGLKRPFELAGFITPWNSPLGLSFIDSIQALVAGCAVLIKPSEVTPRFIEPLRRSFRNFPELGSVVGIIAGGGDVGEALIDAVDIVCFTGSTATGQRVAVRAASRLIPAFLELGGKDPAIILKGADLERAAAGIVWSATMNTGQLCHSIERVYVHNDIADDFTEKVLHAVNAVRLAYPEFSDGTLGPFIHQPQARIVANQLTAAVQGGAQVLTGGPPVQDGGWWMKPTVITHVNHSMSIMRDETFGPVIPIMTYTTTDEAVALANDSRYGLSGSVWGPEDEALLLAGRLNVGGVSINDVSLPSVLMDGEKAAFGQSGLGGSRMGRKAILRFVRPQSLCVSRGSQLNSWWS